MNSQEFDDIIAKIKDICSAFTSQGYGLTSKAGIQSAGNHMFYTANLKKGSINILIEADSRGKYSLTRLNSFTHKTQQMYQSKELFTADELMFAAAFDFPMPEGY